MRRVLGGGGYSLPETDSLLLNIDGWKMTFSFWGWWPIFRLKLAVSFREGINFKFPLVAMMAKKGGTPSRIPPKRGHSSQTAVDDQSY